VLSLLLGAAASAAWASASVLGARAAGQTSQVAFAFQFTLFGCLWAIIPGSVLLVVDPPSAHDLAALAGAGLANSAGALFLGSALGRGDISVVGPLIALEGVVAACLAVAFGGQVGQIAVAGVVITAVGTAVVGGAASARGRAGGGLAALAAAACFGTMLYCLAHQSAPAISAYLLMRVAGLVAIVGIGLFARDAIGGRPSRDSVYPLAAMAACDLSGTLLYVAGTRLGSPVATAVLAAQFGTLLAIWGGVRMHQRLGRFQVAGVVILAVGIAAVAVGSA
jgi:drug/metabolite transporter (DMT)-like permease